MLYTNGTKNDQPYLTNLVYVFTMIAVAISVPAGLLLKYPPGTEQRNMHPTLQQQFQWSNGLHRLQTAKPLGVLGL